MIEDEGVFAHSGCPIVGILPAMLPLEEMNLRKSRSRSNRTGKKQKVSRERYSKKLIAES